jgi:hypothetical protein
MVYVQFSFPSNHGMGLGVTVKPYGALWLEVGPDAASILGS